MGGEQILYFQPLLPRSIALFPGQCVEPYWQQPLPHTASVILC